MTAPTHYRYLPTGPLAVHYAGAVLRYIGPCKQASGCIHLEGGLCVRENDVEEFA